MNSSTFEQHMSLPEPVLQNGFTHVLTPSLDMDKTAYLLKLQKSILRRMNLQNLGELNNKTPYTNLICFSDSRFNQFETNDDFKHDLARSNRKNTFYYNMGSGGEGRSKGEACSSHLNSPFNVLFDTLSNIADAEGQKPSYDFSERLQYLWTQLQKLNFNNLEIQLQAKNNHTGVDGKSCMFLPCQSNQDLLIILDLMNKNKDLEIHDVFLTRNVGQAKKYGLSELKTHEYIFVRALFVLCLVVDEQSLIIYDEIESGLHPYLQSEFVDMFMNAVNTFGNGKATVLIATYAPLVTTAFSTPNVKISLSHDIHNGANFKWDSYTYYGWTSDLILKNHFQLESARSSQFVQQFNKLLKCYQYHDMDGLKQGITELETNHNFRLPYNDPLLDTFHLLKEVAKE